VNDMYSKVKTNTTGSSTESRSCPVNISQQTQAKALYNSITVFGQMWIYSTSENKGNTPRKTYKKYNERHRSKRDMP